MLVLFLVPYRFPKFLRITAKIKVLYQSINLKSHFISAIDYIPRGIVAHVQK